MKIAIVHSFYSGENSSGENEVVLSQASILRSCGHDVRLISVRTDDLVTKRFYKIRTAFKVITGFGLNPLQEIREFSPDITFIHNLFPNFASNWVKSWPGKVIRVIHNQRLFCANGVFFRDGQLCFDCINTSPFEGFKNACYRNSKLATAPLYLAQLRRQLDKRELNRPDRYISLSNDMKDLLVSAGLKNEKIIVLQNFIEDFTNSNSTGASKFQNTWVAAGRITREKGFLNLIENWPPGFKLEIIGDGSDLDYLRQKTLNKKNIDLVGRLDRKELVKRLPSYIGAVYPSLLIEVCPLVLMEFMCAGLPIIGLNIAREPIVGGNEKPAGIILNKFDPESLKIAISKIELHRSDFSNNSRFRYEMKYTPAVWLKNINEIIKQVVTG